jgi:polysaccharide export outer membrane protein
MVRPKPVLLVSLAISLTWVFLAQAQTKPVTTPGVNKEGQPPNSTTATSATPVSTFERNSEDKPPKPPSKIAREDARRYYKAGVKYGRANLFRQALQSFQEALKNDPEYPEALYGLGRAHLDLGHYSEAIEAFQAALKLNPNAADANAGLGEAYAKLKAVKQESRTENNPGAGERVALTEKPPDRTTNIPDLKNNLADVYKVGIGDVLDIRIAGTSNQESTLFTVSTTGMLEYPILGQPLKVLGLTTNEISENMGAELRRRAIGRESDPQVGVRDYNSHTILVSGLVKEPGTKILRREAIPLYVVLADAQPLPEAFQVTVISQHSDKARVVELSDAEQTSMLVLPGDVVSVGAAAKQFFYVGGEVKAPGEFSFHKGLSLTQAIFAAGGVTVRGEKVQLSRGAGDGLLTLSKFKLKDINNGKVPDPLIEPGDRITVLH